MPQCERKKYTTKTFRNYHNPEYNGKIFLKTLESQRKNIKFYLLHPASLKMSDLRLGWERF